MIESHGLEFRLYLIVSKKSKANFKKMKLAFISVNK
jgi:hypothetical protein